MHSEKMAQRLATLRMKHGVEPSLPAFSGNVADKLASASALADFGLLRKAAVGYVKRSERKLAKKQVRDIDVSNVGSRMTSISERPQAGTGSNRGNRRLINSCGVIAVGRDLPAYVKPESKPRKIRQSKAAAPAREYGLADAVSALSNVAPAQLSMAVDAYRDNVPVPPALRGIVQAIRFAVGEFRDDPTVKPTTQEIYACVRELTERRNV